MPELPEVHTVVHELKRKIRNRRISFVDILLPKIIFLGPKTIPNIRSRDLKAVSVFQRRLKGKKIIDVSRRAKIILIYFSGKEVLLIHLKMTGQLIFLPKKEEQKKVRLLNIKDYPKTTLPAKWTHAIFRFTDGSKLFFNDMRQFGYLRLIEEKELDEVTELKNFGPEPLSKNFTFGLFKEIIDKRPKALIKIFLMDQRSISGIGNIYSDEILYYAKILPQRTSATLKRQELKRLYEGTIKILKQAITSKGSSVGDFVRPSGEWGAYGSLHKVYGRKGEKCKACKTVIQSVFINGRTASFCPKCQK
jgi:formamidopyrimidine-DNA glycosylase